ncbi:MAG: phosphatidate cytidylyltransferase [Chloroflexota bacterium]|jgi:phosphatidate cytidylyltransferase
MKKRIAFIVVGVPLGLILFWLGGWIFGIVVGLIVALAGGEYVRLCRTCGYEPAYPLVIGGTGLLIVGRFWDGFESAPWILTLLVFASMIYHLIAYELGRERAAADFGITLGGILYFGWLGGYFISARMLPQGVWWFSLICITGWLVDVGAYLIGRHYGRHPFFPRLSPRKTMEGYFGGIAGGILGGMLIAFILQLIAIASKAPGFPVQIGHGALIGLILGIFTPFGDVGESMFKRMAKVKDSSKLIPGHGGVWDRTDSWLWAMAIGYYLVVWFF